MARTGEFGRAGGGSFVVIWGLPGCNSWGFRVSVFPWLPGANCGRPRAGLRAKDGQPVEKSGVDVGATTVREWSLRADQSIRANRLLTRAAQGGSDGPRPGLPTFLFSQRCPRRVRRIWHDACLPEGPGFFRSRGPQARRNARVPIRMIILAWLPRGGSCHNSRSVPRRRRFTWTNTF